MLWFVGLVLGLGLREDPCVRLWASRLPDSFEESFRVFERWVLEDLVGDPFFCGLSPSELVEWQVNARGRDAMRLRVRLQLWINRKRLRFRTKQKYFTDVSSFFLHNFAAFPPDPSFRFKSDIPPVVGKLYFESCRQILFNSDLGYRSVFLMMAQGLLGIAEFVYVNEHLADEVLKHITRNDGVFRLELPGRKQTRNKLAFATCLSSKGDFADCFRKYMRTVKHDLSEVLVVNNMGVPLTRDNIQQYFNARAVETGVIKQITPACLVCGAETVKFRNRQAKDVPKRLWRKTGYRCVDGHVNWAADYKSTFSGNRYGINPHEIRDLMRTRWESSGANPKVAEFMMGHIDKVDPNRYLSWMKYERHVPLVEYRKALPWLNILSNDPRKVDRSEIQDQLAESRSREEALGKRLVDLERQMNAVREELDRKPSWET